MNADIQEAIDRLDQLRIDITKTEKGHKLEREAYNIQQLLFKASDVVNNWVAVKDSMPEDCGQVFVKYGNGRYGINEWWENDDCWKYSFDNMIVKEWCKPPCS